MRKPKEREKDNILLEDYKQHKHGKQDGQHPKMQHR